MERGEIIARLIAVKQTLETGSAFRPAREAEMMRRLVERHRGTLPLDTVESIWRVIIATFTFVQARFSCTPTCSAGDAAMRDSTRFHFGFTVPFVPHMGASSVVVAHALRFQGRSRAGAGLGDSRPQRSGGARSNSTRRPRSLHACRSWTARTIRPPCRYS